MTRLAVCVNISQDDRQLNFLAEFKSKFITMSRRYGDDSDDEEQTLGHQLAARKIGFVDYQRPKPQTAANSSSAFDKKRPRSWESEPRNDVSKKKLAPSQGSSLLKQSKGHDRHIHAHDDDSDSDSGDNDDDDDELDDDNSSDGGSDDDDGGSSAGGGGGKAGKKAKRNKHAPAEMASNHPVGRFRKVVEVPKVIRRDPRFDGLSGTFNADIFRKSYAFLDEVRDNEIAALKVELAGGEASVGVKSGKKRRKLAAAVPAERRTELQGLLTKLQQQRSEEKVASAVRSSLAAAKKEERAKVAAGLKLPYFPKRREVRQMVATERYKALEARGDAAVAKALKKRRKKLMGKERKAAPFPTRRGVEEGAGR